MTQSLTVQAIINAATEKVWDYYTQSEHIINWNFASPDWCCPSASNNLSIGGKYETRMEAKDGSFGFDFQGTYTALNVGTSFIYILDDKRFVNILLTAELDKTKISITFDADVENDINMQRNGWQAILNNFKNYKENN